jgi:hypothetical protein
MTISKGSNDVKTEILKNVRAYINFEDKYKGWIHFCPLGFQHFIFFPLKVSFSSHEVLVIFIKIKMVYSLKFRPKLNRMSCQHQSNVAICHI